MSLENIISLGDDQMANNFILSFPGGIPTGGDADAVSLRMEEAVTMPEDAGGEYEIVYQGLKLVKPNTTDQMDKHVTINVRVDQQWKIYADLKKWKNAVYNNIDGTKLPSGDTSTTMAVQALDGQKAIVKTFLFSSVWLQKIKVQDLSHTEEGPAKLELTFIFGYWE